MIDLRNKSLPNTICVNGGFFSIYTDFRKWLEFGELIKETRPLSEYYFLFKNDIPKQNFIKELVDFYLNPNITPKQSNEKSNTKIIDYILDGEYIVGSFLAVYQIDLITIEELHWHKFQALFRALPDTSRIMQIASSRSYKATKKSMQKQLEEARTAWSFPVEKAETDEELVNELISEFYGTT